MKKVGLTSQRTCFPCTGSTGVELWWYGKQCVEIAWSNW